MTHVCQQRTSGSHPTSKTDSIIHQLMRVMRFVKAQCVNHQHVKSSQQFQFLLFNRLHIRDICHITKAETKNGKFPMHHPDRKYVNVTDTEYLMRPYLMQPNSGDSWIAMLRKTIGQHLKHTLTGILICIHIDFAKLAIGSDIVHTTHMIVMGMSDQYTVNAAERLRKNLLTKVGTTVYKDTSRRCLHQHRAAQPSIFRIITTADRTLTTDDWNAT